jgi:OOP family OmpA-OmpF porin
MSETRAGGAVSVLMLAVLVAGCTSDGPDPGPPSPSPTTAAADDVVTTAEMSYATATLEIGVHPIVRTDDGLVVTLSLDADDPDGVFETGALLAFQQQVSSDWVDARLFDGIRLLDLEGDRVAPTAADGEMRTVYAETPRGVGESGQPEQVQIAYGDPGGDSLALYVPKVGVVPDVPIVDGEPPELGGDVRIDLEAIAADPVFPMESYSYDLTSQTRTQEDEEGVTIALAADVLFAFDSADLDEAAKEALADAAARIAAREPGPVQVVGHTDDVDDDAYNQDLSERRAQAVGERLAELLDADDYPLEISGAGESEPVADNGSEAGRAVNRRVALSIQTPAVPEEEAEHAAPPAPRRPEGIEYTDGQTPVRVTAPRARVLDGHLVVTVELERLDDAVDSAFGLGNLGVGGLEMPEHFATMKTSGGIAVLNGALATLPVFHRTSEDGIAQPVADVRTNARIDGGQVRSFDLVYPRGLPVGDTVDIELLQGEWRLTDIPVEE